ncbi:furin-like protease 2 [Trichonephila clavipes]|nr:furin-like protease 2 [Trichonephila clavipes]
MACHPEAVFPVLWFEQQEVKRRVKRSVSVNSFTSFQDPLYSEQWFLHGGGCGGYDMNVIPAWQEGFTGKGVVISILDDGIQSNHPDLAQNYHLSPPVQHNTSPDDSRTTVTVSFRDLTGMKLCPDLSPKQLALRIACGTETNPIRREHDSVNGMSSFCALYTTLNGAAGGHLSKDAAFRTVGSRPPL